MDELHRRRIVEAELLAQRIALLLRGVLPDHGVDRVADIAEQEKETTPTASSTATDCRRRRRMKASIQLAFILILLSPLGGEGG